MKRLYLHIGRGKTGTTAIQAFLSRNRATLEPRGVHYIYAGEWDLGIGHQAFAKSFVTDPPDFMKPPRNPEAVRAAIAAEVAASRAPSILLSSENLTLADPTSLASFAEECGIEDVRVIFFGRSQDEVAESQYNQLVKLCRYEMPFADYLATEMGEVDYSAMLDPWAATFGPERIIARIYDAGGQTVIDDFLSCLPLRDSGDPFDRTRGDDNESVGFLALQIYRKLNGFELDEQERQALYGALHEALRSRDVPALLFSAADAQSYRDRFRDSNRRFLREYLNRDGDDLGGRRYSDAERDEVWARIKALDPPL